MATNKDALKKVKNALRDLVLVKYDGATKTDAQIAAIDASVDRLNDEYLRLLGLPTTASYDDIARNLARAQEDLQDIVRMREALASALVSASKLMGSLRSVLALIP